MSEVLFYHLERASLEGVLPGLLEKTLERGWKAVVQFGDAERLKAMNEHLWTYREDSFLPHGAAGDGERQPIWLTSSDDRPNAAQVLFLVEGAKINASDIGELERCIVIFDGGDDDAVKEARQFWKAVAGEGHSAAYWRQTAEGRWEKQTQN